MAALSPDGGQRLPRRRRIARSAEIRTILSRGKRSGTADLDVFHSASPVPFSRAGVIVPKHRQRIVDRNRVKRRLRELLRREVLPRLDAAGLTTDVMVRARRTAYDTSFESLREQLVRWTEGRCSRASSS